MYVTQFCSMGGKNKFLLMGHGQKAVCRLASRRAAGAHAPCSRFLGPVVGAGVKTLFQQFLWPKNWFLGEQRPVVHSKANCGLTKTHLFALNPLLDILTYSLFSCLPDWAGCGRPGGQWPTTRYITLTQKRLLYTHTVISLLHTTPRPQQIYIVTPAQLMGRSSKFLPNAGVYQWCLGIKLRPSYLLKLF